MVVDAEVTIKASKAAVWAVITDIENSAKNVSGIQGIEIVERPARGLVGLRWRETRMLFGKPATVEKRITEAVENDYYVTRAESDGYEFITTKKVALGNGGVTYSESHASNPQTFMGKMLSAPMGLLFKGVARKAILQDLNDIRSATERS